MDHRGGYSSSAKCVVTATGPEVAQTIKNSHYLGKTYHKTKEMAVRIDGEVGECLQFFQLNSKEKRSFKRRDNTSSPRHMTREG